jgi:hypothetical protein
MVAMTSTMHHTSRLRELIGVAVRNNETARPLRLGNKKNSNYRVETIFEWGKEPFMADTPGQQLCLHTEGQ